MNTAQSRQTKYCTQIELIAKKFGHVSNAQILTELHKTFPDVSATTVHRATSRLASRGELGIAPADASGAMRYDANTEPHDHFVCGTCGMLRDVDIADKIHPLLAASIEGCGVTSRVTVTGICKACSAKGENA